MKFTNYSLIFLRLVLFSQIPDHFVAVFVVVDPFIETLKLFYAAASPVSVVDFVEQHRCECERGVSTRKEVVAALLVVHLVR